MDIAEPSPAVAMTAVSPTQDLRRAVVMLALWTLYAIWRQWGHWPDDLSALYIAGHLWQTGQTDLIYAAPPGFFGSHAASWDPVMADLGIAGKVTFPYVYPPLWAALLGPVTDLLGPQAFANAVLLIQMPMLAASVLMAARLMRPATMPMLTWALIGIVILLASTQSYIALWHNQPTITVGFLVLLCFTCLDADRPIAAGAALALAAAIKLTPAALVLILLLDRQYRATLSFALFGAALGLLSLALTGTALHATFLDSLGLIQDGALLNAVNVSLLPALMSLGAAIGLGPAFDTQSHLVILSPVPGWLSIGLALTALALTTAFLMALKDKPGPERRATGLFALWLILTLFGPLGWQHYYLLPLLLLPGLIARLTPRAGLLLGLAIALPSIRFVFLTIGFLPWPVANYVWLACPGWLAVLLTLYVRARRNA